MDTEDIDSQDNFRIQRIAGGSVIKYPPVFSNDSEFLFIIWNNIVRVYSTTTGQWIRDFDGCNNSIVSIQCDFDIPKIIHACTDSGELITWKWKSGTIAQKIQLKFDGPSQSKPSIQTFNVFKLMDKSYGLVSNICQLNNSYAKTELAIFDLESGLKVPPVLPLHLTHKKIKVDVAKSNHNYFAIIQGSRLFVYNYVRKVYKVWQSANKVPFTCLSCHPVEEMIATGDETGKIFVWRNIFAHKIEPMTSLYHWHHTRVNAIAFTESGSTFYSGGEECVLVKWNLHNFYERSFLPRMFGAPEHIVLCIGNNKVAVSTNDNGIQMYNPQNQPITIIQNFTWVANDNTNIDKFPIGLKINPRNSSLVLNGRVGHLQFYSTQTRSLLYNMDVTFQNRLNFETAKILYNTIVTHTALNMNWMVTGELLDDLEHTIDVRLKFWQFDEQKQTYSLNTQIELPHENGLTALEFSSLYNVEHLLCASSGKDNYVKLWSLEDSTSIYKKGKTWQCIERINYKDLPVNALQFSQDSTVLAVGYGNTLCVYTAKDLQLKCILNAPSGLDGNISKLLINFNLHRPQNSSSKIKNGNQKEIKEVLYEQQKLVNKKNDNLLTMVKNYIDNNDQKLIQYLEQQQHLQYTCSESIDDDNDNDSDKFKNLLNSDEKQLLFSNILSIKELNLYVKLKLFYKFNINIKTNNANIKLLKEYIKNNIETVQNMEMDADKLNNKLSSNDKFLAIKDFYHYENYKKMNLPLVKLNEEQHKQQKQQTQQKQQQQLHQKHQHVQEQQPNQQPPSVINKINTNLTEKYLPSINKSLAEIRHIVFGTGDFAHLIIVCTEKRLLIWDLLTLRLKSAFKLSVDKICVDIYTSLIAVFTIFNELYIFLPNGIPLYERKNVPSIYGAAWIPRRYPLQNSINLNWQATSQLYFLSKNQEILHLVADDDSDLSSHIAYLDDTPQPLPLTPFGALIAKQIHNATIGKQQNVYQQNDLRSIIRGGSHNYAVKTLIGFQIHTMIPAHLVSQDFISAMFNDDDVKTADINMATTNNDNNVVSYHDADVDVDDNDDDNNNYVSFQQKIKLREKWSKVDKKNYDEKQQSQDLSETEYTTLTKIMKEQIKIL